MKKTKEQCELIQKKWNERKHSIEFAKGTGITRKQVIKLRNALGKKDYYTIFCLLREYHQNKDKCREFKKRLAQQVIDWVNNPKPRYKSPLSMKCLEVLNPISQGIEDSFRNILW